MARAIKFCPVLKELRIHLCPKGESSEGVREFLHEHYVFLKKENPKFPILIRECSGIQPKLWARYGFGKEKCSDLGKASAEEVMNRIIALNSA